MVVNDLLTKGVQMEIVVIDGITQFENYSFLVTYTGRDPMD